MTVASGRGDCVADEGRKMPVAVFCAHQRGEYTGLRGMSHGLGFEALDEDAVEERLEGADGLECGGLIKEKGLSACFQDDTRSGGDDNRAARYLASVPTEYLDVADRTKSWSGREEGLAHHCIDSRRRQKRWIVRELNG